VSDIQEYIVPQRALNLLKGQKWAQGDVVVWEGEPKPPVVGANVGNRLYAGKKRMFKGHKHERTKAKRVMRRTILLKDMKKRIIRYRGYYQRRQPHPLKPAKATKSSKLPF